MEHLNQKPTCISLPEIEIYLTTYFFHGIDDRPPRKHHHPCYEVVCTKHQRETFFTIIPPLAEHFSKTSEEGRTCSFLFRFTAEHPRDFCSVIGKIEKETIIPDIFGAFSQIQTIAELFRQNDVGIHEQIKAEFQLFFVKLARFFYMEQTGGSQELQTLDDERIAILEDFFNIEMRYPDCSKQQLAAKIGVCERQLTRILQKTYNSTFSAILLQSRMNMAQAMLMQGHSSIAEVAESVGYTSVGAFRHAYKSFFGVLPSKK